MKGKREEEEEEEEEEEKRGKKEKEKEENRKQGKGKFSQGNGGTKTCHDSSIGSCVRASVTEARVTVHVRKRKVVYSIFILP